ncbi:NifB/NifX family molybdenum-iron cluster-binding protein [Leadbettera azotonutricia]|uniref:Dinitrogenase iron-molybdenum cofactor biosynthesis protein n=1 Tax=Leadbettera azotonutricia (strain ATCC BAA-888 / DSM 13862 / ZAS-9) TaxID=545695 RepID=F5Y799_LEAAZ|nr:NifB/NifX family molybdenum-iron cluster-binding protein [Leadbettera azotonutricia]AEF82364.1 dinitrogenase iron-molybdenum cofactor biosynthesis protein [Leadbettera azotonutricia ZAS-9]
MSWKVAVTSADGVLINQHFGHAKWFFIYNLEPDGSFALLEKRDTAPWCSEENHERDSPGASLGIAAAISDCTAVLTARIGPPAQKKLELAGISVYEQPDSIANALPKLAAYYGKSQAAKL